MDTPRTPRLLAPALLLSLVAALLVGGSPAAPAAAERATATSGATSEPRRTAKVASGRVGFDLANTNSSSVLCLPLPDGRIYPVRGRLVGPRSVISGRAAVITVNVLVHDAGTGGWFFHLRSNPAYDYATQLARRGETSLVLDRLGYGDSPVRNGNDTCLGAQVSMLHQVVQKLYAGNYEYLGRRAKSDPPNASHVVLHGHGTGATIAQLEAARFDDVDGLVLIAPATTSPSRLALEAVGAQARACLSRTFAPFGATARAYDRLLFRTATRPVRRAALERRNPTPCGDVASLPGALASLTLSDREVDVPVLVLRGGADARTSGGATSVSSTDEVSRRTIKGAGSALPLERSAPKTRRTVLRWLGTL